MQDGNLKSGSDQGKITIGANVDVRQLMGEIQAEVDRKKRAGLYPPEILEELDLVLGDTSDESLRNAMLLLRQSAVFSAAVSTASQKGPVPLVTASFKRAVRGSTSWYIAGVLQQVELFAAHSIRVTSLLADRMRRLEEQVNDTLQEVRREFAGQLIEARQSADAMVRTQERLAADIEALQADEDLVRWRQRVALLERSVRGLRERLLADQPTAPAAVPSSPQRGLAADIAVDYLDFENHFRGSEEDIRDKQRSYVQLFRASPGAVVDLGCGRGEFLGLLAEAGIEAYGVDRHPDMIDLCKEKGFDAREADVLEHLASLPEGSLGGVFSAQMIEHLDVRDVPRFFDLAANALAPGGRLVVETINPECLFVFAAAFYVDLGHLRPLHPLTLQFLAQKMGFTQIEVKYSSIPPQELRPAAIDATASEPLDDVVAVVNENFKRVDDVLFGPQDYALIATR